MESQTIQQILNQESEEDFLQVPQVNPTPQARQEAAPSQEGSYYFLNYYITIKTLTLKPSILFYSFPTFRSQASSNRNSPGCSKSQAGSSSRG
jgi:hypothetical protein